LLVHHAEAGNVPYGRVARVIVTDSIIKIRAQLHHPEGPCDTWEVIPT
jgi:hypothetical protein